MGGKYAQAYFSYDTMKSGGLTQSHLRFGDEPIRSTYLVSSADFVAVHAPTYVKKYDTTEDLKEGGTFLLNCPWTVEELDAHLPAKMKRDLARKHANFYIIDAAKLAQRDRPGQAHQQHPPGRLLRPDQGHPHGSGH